MNTFCIILINYIFNLSFFLPSLLFICLRLSLTIATTNMMIDEMNSNRMHNIMIIYILWVWSVVFCLMCGHEKACHCFARKCYGYYFHNPQYGTLFYFLFLILSDFYYYPPKKREEEIETENTITDRFPLKIIIVFMPKLRTYLFP